MRRYNEPKTAENADTARRAGPGICSLCADHLRRGLKPRVHRAKGDNVDPLQVQRGIDIRAKIAADRRRRGIPFEGYPMPGEKPDRPDSDELHERKRITAQATYARRKAAS